MGNVYAVHRNPTKCSKAGLRSDHVSAAGCCISELAMVIRRDENAIVSTMELTENYDNLIITPCALFE